MNALRCRRRRLHGRVELQSSPDATSMTAIRLATFYLPTSDRNNWIYPRNCFDVF